MEVYYVITLVITFKQSHEHLSRVMFGYMARMEALRVIMTLECERSTFPKSCNRSLFFSENVSKPHNKVEIKTL